MAFALFTHNKLHSNTNTGVWLERVEPAGGEAAEVEAEAERLGGVLKLPGPGPEDGANWAFCSP